MLEADALPFKSGRAGGTGDDESKVLGVVWDVDGVDSDAEDARGVIGDHDLPRHCQQSVVHAFNSTVVRKC